LTVRYAVPSTTTNSTYPLRVEFFQADSDRQEGRTFLGFDTYAAGEAGTTKTVTFTPFPIAAGYKLVATATDGNNNTSEFSSSVTVDGPHVPPVLADIGDNYSIEVSESTVALAAAPVIDFGLSASDSDSLQDLAFSLAVDPSPPEGCIAYDASNPAHANLLLISIPTQAGFPGAPPSDSSSATGTLRVKAGPNAAGIWCFLVRVTDGILSDERAVTLTINRTNSSPHITSNGGGDTATIGVQENAPSVTDVNATDLDAEQTPDFSISGGADADKFAISPATGVLTFVSAPDFENPADADGNNVYEVIVQASDSSAIDTQSLSVTVTDAENPVLQGTPADDVFVVRRNPAAGLRTTAVDKAGTS
jgi:hypothetical protein